MELIPESIMGMLLDAGMFILVLELLRGADTQKKEYRLLSGTFAVGFAFGIAAKCMTDGNLAVIVLFALGLVLAAMAFALTFSGRGKDHESR